MKLRRKKLITLLVVLGLFSMNNAVEYVNQMKDTHAVQLLDALSGPLPEPAAYAQAATALRPEDNNSIIE